MSPARNAVSNSLGWLAPLVAYYLALPVIMKAIGAEKFGLLVFAMTLVGYIGVVNPPVAAGNVRFLAVAYGRGDREAFISSALSGAMLGITLAVGAGGVLFALAPFLAGRFFGATDALRQEARIVIWWGCGGFIASSLMGVACALPAAMQRYGMINLCTSGGAGLGMFLGAWQAMRAKSAAAVIVGQIAGNAVALAVLVLFNLRILMAMGLTLRTAKRHCGSGIRELFKFSATLWLSQVCSTVALQTDKFIVGLTAGPVALAWYSIPAKVGEQFAGAIGRVSVALYPLTSSHAGRGDRETVVTLYNVFLRLSLMSSVVAVVIAKSYGDEILRLWLKVSLPPNAGAILLIAMLTALFRTPGTVAYHVANGLGRAGVTLVAGALGATASAVGVYVGAVCDGTTGAAAGFLASAVLTNVAFDGVVRIRLLGESLGKWSDPYVRTILTLLVAGLLSMPFVAGSHGPARIAVFKACAAVALSLVVGFCFGLLRIEDIRLLLQKHDPEEVLTAENLTGQSLKPISSCSLSASPRRSWLTQSIAARVAKNREIL